MSNTYATLTDLKTYLQATDIQTSDDTLLQSLLDASSDAFDSAVGRTILQQTFTETRNGNHEQAISLYNYPITSVASVVINGVTIAQSPDTNSWGWVNDDSFVYLRPVYYPGYFAAGGYYPLPHFLDDRPMRFDKGKQNVVITYTAGFATVPNDIKHAIVVMAAFKYHAKDHIGMKTMSQGGMVTSSYTDDCPPEVKYTIDRYRRIVI